MPTSLIGKHCNGKSCDIAGVISVQLRTAPYPSVQSGAKEKNGILRQRFDRIGCPGNDNDVLFCEN